jgi:hypothetical protein
MVMNSIRCWEVLSFPVEKGQHHGVSAKLADFNALLYTDYQNISENFHLTITVFDRVYLGFVLGHHINRHTLLT